MIFSLRVRVLYAFEHVSSHSALIFGFGYFVFIISETWFQFDIISVINKYSHFSKQFIVGYILFCVVWGVYKNKEYKSIANKYKENNVHEIEMYMRVNELRMKYYEKKLDVLVGLSPISLVILFIEKMPEVSKVFPLLNSDYYSIVASACFGGYIFYLGRTLIHYRKLVSKSIALQYDANIGSTKRNFSDLYNEFRDKQKYS